MTEAAPVKPSRLLLLHTLVLGLLIGQVVLLLYLWRQTNAAAAIDRDSIAQRAKFAEQIQASITQRARFAEQIEISLAQRARFAEQIGEINRRLEDLEHQP
jgi:hypothetical protein